jgi:hypothetical protein
LTQTFGKNYNSDATSSVLSTQGKLLGFLP